MSEFVKMRKGDQFIDVHYLVVNAHKALGWVMVPDEPVIEPPAETAPAPKKIKKGA